MEEGYRSGTPLSFKGKICNDEKAESFGRCSFGAKALGEPTVKIISASDKKFLLIVFSIISPLLVAVLYNYPFMEYFAVMLRRISDILSFLFYFFASYFPGLVALYAVSRDFRNKKILKQIILLLGYLLIIVPISLFVGFGTACQINRNCVMP